MKAIPLFLLVLILTWAPRVLAQINENNLPPDTREQLEAFKIAFFTRQLSLSSDEAQSFWPVYNRFSEEGDQLRAAERRLQARMRRAYDSGTEAELEKLSDEYIDLQRQQYELRARYHNEFKKVLPIRKVVRLYKAESEFKRELLLELRRRRQERLRND